MRFIDTCVFYAAFFKNEKNHAPAKRIIDSIIASKENAVYSDYVLDELLTLIKLRKGHRAATEVLDIILSSETELLKVGQIHINLALEIFKSYPALSFTDSTTVAIMLEKGMGEVYSFDGGFDSVPKIARLTEPP